MKEYSVEDKLKVSQFHGAWKFIERIDTIKRELINITNERNSPVHQNRKLLFLSNLDLLNSFKKELWGKLSDGERKIVSSRYSEIKNHFYQQIKGQNIDFLDLADKFDDFELELREVCENHGLDSANKQDIGDVMSD